MFSIFHISIGSTPVVLKIYIGDYVKGNFLVPLMSISDCTCVILQPKKIACDGKSIITVIFQA